MHRAAVRDLDPDLPDLRGDAQQQPGAAARRAHATQVQINAVEREWGFNKPIYVQYYKTMEKIFSGTVISYTQEINVDKQIVSDLPPTLSLAIGAGIIWFLFGVVFGVLAAVRAGRLLDRALTVLSLIGVSTPVFFLGAMLPSTLASRPGSSPTGTT